MVFLVSFWSRVVSGFFTFYTLYRCSFTLLLSVIINLSAIFSSFVCHSIFFQTQVNILFSVPLHQMYLYYTSTLLIWQNLKNVSIFANLDLFPGGVSICDPDSMSSRQGVESDLDIPTRGNQEGQERLSQVKQHSNPNWDPRFITIVRGLFSPWK